MFMLGILVQVWIGLFFGQFCIFQFLGVVQMYLQVCFSVLWLLRQMKISLGIEFLNSIGKFSFVIFLCIVVLLLWWMVMWWNCGVKLDLFVGRVGRQWLMKFLIGLISLICRLFFQFSVVLMFEGLKELSVKVVLGWKDGLQIELIELVKGFVDYYLLVLFVDKFDFMLQFYYIVVCCDDEVVMCKEIVELGFLVLFESLVFGLVFIYFDGCEMLGYVYEYIYVMFEGWEMQGWLKDKLVQV